MYGKHHSLESKKKMSEAHAGLQVGKKNHNYGKRFSKEHRRKLSEAHAGEKSHSAKLTWEEVREIRKKYATGKFTQAVLAKEYGVGRPQIGYIVNNKHWIEKL